jgi:hypothetical protein
MEMYFKGIVSEDYNSSKLNQPAGFGFFSHVSLEINKKFSTQFNFSRYNFFSYFLFLLSSSFKFLGILHQTYSNSLFYWNFNSVKARYIPSLLLFIRLSSALKECYTISIPM